MATSLIGTNTSNPEVFFRYALFDFRDLDGAALMESARIEENVLAILTRLNNQASTVREILSRIATLDEPDRRHYFSKFLILSGLRRLEEVTQQEAQKMPILNDILDHRVIGPAIVQGRAEGREEGRAEGRSEGRAEGRSEVLRKLLQQRFGAIPSWVESRISNLGASEVDDLAVRFLDARSFEDLFGS